MDVSRENSTPGNNGVDELKLAERYVSELIATESSSIFFNISASERRFLKAYLGYIKTEDIEDNRLLRQKLSAPKFVQNVLWPSGTTDEPTSILSAEKEDGNFRLDELLEESDSPWEVPTIFNHTRESLKEMFLSGRNRTANEQISLLKTFQVCKKKKKKDYLREKN